MRTDNVFDLQTEMRDVLLDGVNEKRDEYVRQVIAEIDWDDEKVCDVVFQGKPETVTGNISERDYGLSWGCQYNVWPSRGQAPPRRHYYKPGDSHRRVIRFQKKDLDVVGIDPETGEDLE